MKKVKYIILIVIFLSWSQQMIRDHNSASAAPSPSVDNAIASIRDAEKSGADVSKMETSFNEALDLLQQAETSSFTTCPSHDSCVEKANLIFTSINDESKSLLTESEQTSGFNAIINITIYSSITAFAGAFASIYCHRAWKAAQIRTFLDMELVEKEK